MSGILGGLIGSFKTAVVGLVNKYFISVQSSTPKYTLSSVAADSNQNTYYATYSGSTTRTGFLLLKKAKDGSVVWAKNISTGYTTGGPGDAINGIKIIGSNLWAWGTMRLAGSITPGSNSWLIKFDLNGNIVSQWYQNWSDSSLTSEIINFEIDSSGYFHMTFFNTFDKSSGYYDLILNSSLVAVKQRTYSIGNPYQINSRPSDGTVFYSVNNNGTGFNLVTPGTAPTSDTRYLYTTTDPSAYSSSGNNIKKFIFDSSGNIYILSYVVTTISVPYPSYFLISKFNTSLTHQWTKKIASGTSGVNHNTYAISLAIDSSANIYILLLNLGNYAIILKYNSSGTLQWKSRLTFTLGGTVQNPPTGNLIVDSNDDLIWQGGYGGGSNDGLILKIKSDGSMANGTARTITGTSPALIVTIAADTTYLDSAYTYTPAFSSPPSGYIYYQNYTAAFTTTMPYTVTNTDITSSYTENIYSTT